MNQHKIHHAIDANLSQLRLSSENIAEIRSRISAQGREKPPIHIRRKLMIVLVSLLGCVLLASAIGAPQRFLSTFHTDTNYIIALLEMDAMPDFSDEIIVSAAVRRVWGNEIADFLEETRACVAMPKWMPEGFRINMLNFEQHDVAEPVCTAFFIDDGGKSLDITIRVLSAGSDGISYFSMHSSGVNIETWNIGGIEYHYEETPHGSYVIWIENNCLVTLCSETGRDDLLRMIESIYE